MLNVGCKLSDRNFGAKVSVCFPRGDAYDEHAAKLKKFLSKHADKIESLLLSGELEAVFDGARQERDGRIEPTISSAVQNRPDVPVAPVAVYAPWPREGSVTKKDIAAAWEIGASSWDRLVGALASPPARVASPVGKDGNPVPNAPARWWVADVEEIMRKRGIQRRRIVVKG